MRNYTISVAKTTAKLICAIVFIYAKCWFSYEAAHNIEYCMTSFTKTTFVQIVLLQQSFNELLNMFFRKKNLGVCILEHVHFIEQIRYNQ